MQSEVTFLPEERPTDCFRNYFFWVPHNSIWLFWFFWTSHTRDLHTSHGTSFSFHYFGFNSIYSLIIFVYVLNLYSSTLSQIHLFFQMSKWVAGVFYFWICSRNINRKFYFYHFDDKFLLSCSVVKKDARSFSPSFWRFNYWLILWKMWCRCISSSRYWLGKFFP
jgi:hypothetical protein